ncbi:MAG: hypothetical protein ACP5IV_07890 [Caldisericia bacterium]
MSEKDKEIIKKELEGLDKELLRKIENSMDEVLSKDPKNEIAIELKKLVREVEK